MDCGLRMFVLLDGEVEGRKSLEDMAGDGIRGALGLSLPVDGVWIRIEPFLIRTEGCATGGVLALGVLTLFLFLFPYAAALTSSNVKCGSGHFVGLVHSSLSYTETRRLRRNS